MRLRPRVRLCDCVQKEKVVPHLPEDPASQQPLEQTRGLFISISYSKTLSRPIIYAYYYHDLSSASGGFAPRPPHMLHPWTPMGTFVLRPLIFPPLKKILRVTMTAV